jgi:hypothetical protein
MGINDQHGCQFQGWSEYDDFTLSHLKAKDADAAGTLMGREFYDWTPNLKNAQFTLHLMNAGKTHNFIIFSSGSILRL